jgi:hypothetical protein
MFDAEGAPLEAGTQPALFDRLDSDPCVDCPKPIDACDVCPERAR